MGFDAAEAAWGCLPLPLDAPLRQKAGRFFESLQAAMVPSLESPELTNPESGSGWVLCVGKFLEAISKGKVPHGPLLAFELQGREFGACGLRRCPRKGVLWTFPDDPEKVEAGAELVLSLLGDYLKFLGKYPEDPAFAPGVAAGSGASGVPGVTAGVAAVPVGYDDTTGWMKANVATLEEHRIPRTVPYREVILTLDVADVLEDRQYVWKCRGALQPLGVPMLASLACEAGGFSDYTYWIVSPSQQDSLPEMWAVRQTGNGTVQFKKMTPTVRQTSESKVLEKSAGGWQDLSYQATNLDAWTPREAIVMDVEGRERVWVAAWWTRSGVEKLMVQVAALPDQLKVPAEVPAETAGPWRRR